MKGLANPNLKTRRAKEHLDALKREVDAFVESKPYTVSTQDDFDAGKHIITLDFQPAPIWPIGAIAGDFISCLRSSLDHLVYGLIVANSGKRSNTSYFPIIGEFTDETLSTIDNATRGMLPEAVSIVKLYQPYHHGNAYESTHLWRLNKLWNIDKHRYVPFHCGFRTMPISVPG
jgi:hypothetical protein